GGIAVRRGDRHEAVIAYERAAKFHLPHPEVYYRLGRAYAAVGKYPEATLAFEESVRLLEEAPEGAAGPEQENGLAIDIPSAPQVATVYSWLGRVLLRMDDLAAAEAAYRKAVERGPALADPHRALGEIYESRGETDRAITAYHQYLRLAPKGGETETVRRRIEILERAR
ncbi:MAG: tetratricopeptide repeat protein, partial [Candidatus Methylomirabilales bacterium]